MVYGIEPPRQTSAHRRRAPLAGSGPRSPPPSMHPAFCYAAARRAAACAAARAAVFTPRSARSSLASARSAVWAALLLASGVSFAADATSTTAAAAATSATFSVLNKADDPLEWGGVLVVGIAGSLPMPTDAAQWNVRLNGVPLGVAKVLTGAGTDAEPPASDETVYRLVLTRIDFSANESDKSAGDVAAATIEAVAPRRMGFNPVLVAIDYAGQPLAARPVEGSNRFRNTVMFRLAEGWEWAVGLAAIVLLVVAMIFSGRHGAILRDEKPAGLPSRQRLYSLGRTQLAFWTTLVVGGFIFLYITTGQFWGLLNNTALALLGISAATTALSGVADLAPSPPPSANPPPPQQHVGFLTDIVSDAYGMNIHRVQMVIWTVVFGFVFLKQLLTQFSFPQFDATTFGLMGISSATYVWFKRNEP